MTIRKQIIDELSKPVLIQGEYERLKQCLIVKGKLDPNIDQWFKGAIESLFYRPNTFALILVGDQFINKSIFFRKLSSCFSYEYSGDENYIYEEFIFDTEFRTKGHLNLPLSSGFTTEFGEYPCDKRLCSYCSSTEKWVFPQRRNFVVINLIDIDIELLNSINVLEVWKELFSRYKLK